MLDVDIYRPTREKRAAKPKVERWLQERYDRGGAARRQRNKQGSIDDEAIQI